METRWRTDGLARRRWCCPDCGERWTTLGPDRRKPRPKRKGGKAHPKLDLDQVRRALTDRQSSDVQLAAELGVSRQAINQIRRGVSWASAFPKLPRRPWLDCQDCRHWSNGECAIGFPDPVEEGTSFACDCDLYEM